jgi:phosphatidylserine/phosphatidylglycerophosphate/cardiolipin synthase-like enzyme
MQESDFFSSPLHCISVALILSGVALFAPGALGDAGSLYPVQSLRVAFSPRSGADQDVLKLIQQARSRIDIAMFTFSRADFAKALCDAAGRRRIPTRLLVDEQMAMPANRPFFEKMAAHGVQIVAVKLAPGGRMHFKCVVVDCRWVATGAANWTQQAFDANVEDLLLIESPELAVRYLARFDEIRQDGESIYAPSDITGASAKAEKAGVGIFKTGSRASFQGMPFRTVAGIKSVDVFFMPGTNGVEALLGQLQAAQERIDVGMYLLNYPRLAEMLMAKAGESKVRLTVDKGMLEPANAEVLRKLIGAGCEIKVYGGERESLHLKTAVIDQRFVWSGSANWTSGAFSRNTEDLIRFDSPGLAGLYTAFLDRIAQQSMTYAPQDAAIPPGEVETKKGPAQHLPPTGPRNDYSALSVPAFPEIPLRGHVEYLPDDRYLPSLLRVIEGAKQSILGTMFVFSEQKSEAPAQKAILKALASAVQRGVYVYLVLHVPETPTNTLLEEHSNRAEFLRRLGVDVRLGRPERPMHAKLFVVDQSRVLLGSHNWSEGSLGGTRVHEASLLVTLSQPDERLADYVLSRPALSDMRSRDLWGGELSRLYRLRRMPRAEKEQMIEEWLQECAP